MNTHACISKFCAGGAVAGAVAGAALGDPLIPTPRSAEAHYPRGWRDSCNSRIIVTRIVGIRGTAQTEGGVTPTCSSVQCWEH